MTTPRNIALALLFLLFVYFLVFHSEEICHNVKGESNCVPSWRNLVVEEFPLTPQNNKTKMDSNEEEEDDDEDLYGERIPPFTGETRQQYKKRLKAYHKMRRLYGAIFQTNHEYQFTEEQLERQQIMDKYCERNFVREKRIRSKPTLHLIEKYHIGQCLVPKVASTNWKRILFILNGANQTFINNLTKEEVNKLKWKREREPTKPQKIRGSNKERSTFFTFMFSRHPFERILSAFRNKFLDPYNKQYLKTFGKYIFGPNWNRTQEKITFARFVRYIIRIYDMRGGDSDFDVHWKPIVSICNPCLIRYTFLGKMETLIKDTNTILNTTKVSNLVEFAYEKPDKYLVKTEALMKKYYSTLSPEERRHLFLIYKKDFQAFGYKNDLSTLLKN